MKYILVAFKAKNSLYRFVEFLKSKNIQAYIVNTPSPLTTSCGLSAKVNLSAYNFLIDLLRKNYFNNLLGCYIIETNGLQQKFEKIF